MLGFSYYFWLCSVVFIINQLVEKLGLFIPFVHSYLDDIVCPGIVLGFALFVQQHFTYRVANYRLPLSHILFFVVWYSFLFELLFPLWDNRHHADALDILAYGGGAFWFYYFGNKEVKHLWLTLDGIRKVN